MKNGIRTSMRLFGNSARRRTRSKIPTRKAFALGLALVCLTTVACEESARVRITYKQLAYFHTYQTSAGGSTSAGNDGVFILYRIASIRNDEPGAQAFEFDPKKLVTVADGFGSEHPSSETYLLGQYYQGEETVAPGDFQTSGLWCVIIKAMSDDIKADFGGFSGTSKKVDLVHQVQPDQPVSLIRTSGNESDFTGFGEADAESLQNKCAGG